MNEKIFVQATAFLYQNPTGHSSGKRAKDGNQSNEHIIYVEALRGIRSPITDQWNK
jgi:hypothetical protein